MSNSVDEDQATELRKLISEVDIKAVQPKESIDKEKEQESYPQIDILNLPPRKEVHGKKKSRVHFKLSRSILRLIFVLLLAMAVIIGVIYLFENGLLEFTLKENTVIVPEEFIEHSRTLTHSKT